MFRWAILSNTTISPLVRRLKRELEVTQQSCDFFSAEYSEATQQIYAEGSELSRFKPDLAVLHLDLQHIKPDLELSLPLEIPAIREAILREVVEHVVTLVKMLRLKTNATLLVSNFPPTPRSALGIGLDHIYKNAIRRANLEIESQISSLPQCHVVDCDSLWAEAGWSDRDRRFEVIAQMPLGPKIQKLLVDEWVRYFRALRGLSRKCIVVDLDNTLWKGILGEDGAEAIQMGDTPEGRGHRQFQLALKALSRRGTILAINSKNNSEEALEVIRNHPDMLLREQDFAAAQINWEDKPTNLARITGELNIGYQHVVFLDDNPSERAWMRESHPQILVPEMPQDSSGFSDVLTHCDIDQLVVTEEDIKRSRMYWEDRQRRAFQSEVRSYDDFLKDLRIEVEIQTLQPQLLERAAQLCQRTNQFNLTTNRYTTEQIKALAEAPSGLVLVASVRDRFGEYGWVGLVIATADNELLTIDSFLLSCRVLGKRVEFALFSELARWGAERKCKIIQGAFVPSGKNKACADFYEKCGMTSSGDLAAPSQRLFSAKITELPPLPIEHIKLAVNF